MATESAKRDPNYVTTLMGVDMSTGLLPTRVYVDESTHRLLVSAVITSGGTAGTQYAETNTTSPGTGTLSLGRYTLAAPVLTDGQMYGLQLDSSGNLKVTGSLSVGGTTDNAAFTAGSSTGTPAMGFYHSTIDAVTDGRSAALAIDTKRNLFTVLRDAAGNARGVNVTAGNALTVDGSASTQPVSGTVSIGSNQSVNLNQIAGFGVVTSGNGVQKVTIADTSSNSYLSAVHGQNLAGTGLFPAQILAEFDDVAPTSITENQFGNLRMSANRNLYGTIRDAAGNERGVNVNASSQMSVSVDNTPLVTLDNNRLVRISGNGGATLDATVGAGSAPTNALIAGALYNSTEISPTTGQSFALQADSKGRLRGVIMDAAGNTRGANVTAGNALTVDGSATTQPVSQATASSLNAQVVGNIADAGTDSGNPVKVGGKLNTTLPTYTDGQRGDLQIGTRGALKTALFVNNSSLPINTRADNADAVATSTNADNLAVQSRNTVYNGTTWDRQPGDTTGTYAVGNVAAAVADAGNPVKVGGKYNSAMPTYTDGQRGNLELTTRGSLKTTIFANDTNTPVAYSADNADTGGTSATSNKLFVVSRNTVFNGTSWDRMRGDTTGIYAVGNIASAAADSGNPVKIGGKYNLTVPTFTDGQRGDIQLTSRGALMAAIVDGSGVQITSFGGGTQYAELTSTTSSTGTLALGRYQTSLPVLTNNQMYEPMLDSSGRLLVNIAAGSSAGTQYATSTASTAPTGTVAMGWDGTTIKALALDSSGLLKVSGLSGTVGDVSTVDGKPVASTADGVQLNSLADELGDPLRTTAGALNVNVANTVLSALTSYANQSTSGRLSTATTLTLTLTNPAATAMIILTGTFSIQANLQYSYDGLNFNNIPMTTLTSQTITAGQVTTVINNNVSNSTDAYIGIRSLAGVKAIRLNIGTFTSGAVNATIIATQAPLTNLDAYNAVTSDTQYSTAASGGNSFAPISSTMGLVYNGTSWSRAREVINATNSTGTGIAAVGLTAQFDDVSPTAITENQFGHLRMSTNRNLYGTIRDAAGNERGANVTAANQLNVTLPSEGASAGTAPTTVILAGMITSSGTITELSTAGKVGDNTLERQLSVMPSLWNGGATDRQRSNESVSLLASAARTTTQTSADLLNYNGLSAIDIIVDMTVVGTGSITMTINGKDPASGKYYLLLSGAAIITNSTNRYKVGPTIAAVTNSIAQDYIPRTFQIVITANNANAATYSVGYNLSRS